MSTRTEKELLQNLENILLASSCPATFVEGDEEHFDLVHAIHKADDKCKETVGDYYFIKDDNYKDHIFVTTRLIKENINVPEEKVLKVIELFNYSILKGAYIYNSGNLEFRYVAIIDDELSDEETANQIMQAVSVVSAYVYETANAIILEMEGK